MVTVEFAALRYLDQWVLQEAPLREGLLSEKHEERRKAIEKAAVFFRIARNLPTRYDRECGLPRYGPVVDELARLPAAVESPAELVPRFARSLSTRYGGKGTLSCSSKLLWLRYRHPVVIYDARARTALKTPEGDYAAFLDAWERRWEQHSQGIAEVCDRLSRRITQAECAGRIRPDQVAELAVTPWFQRRVLDVKLWYDAGAD